MLLAVREVGESWGLGQWQEALRGRGRYRLAWVDAWNPHTGEEQTLLAEGGQMVQQPTLAVTAETIQRRTQTLLAASTEPGAVLTLTFLTPLRLIHHGHLMRWFTFSFFFQRLVERLYGLAEHFSPNPVAYQRPNLIADVERLLPLAEKAEVVANRTEWWDVTGYSQRQGGETHIGGLIGSVDLRCDDWSPLLPYLLWGQSTQLGKNVVKGCGAYSISLSYPEDIFRRKEAKAHGHHSTFGRR